MWGGEQIEVNASCPGFRNDGMLIRGIELAHFRIAPRENQARGYETSTWLPRLAAPVRERMAGMKAAASRK